ncbi:MAG: uracil-DNA glycosylase [Actinomycetota bacterium]
MTGPHPADRVGDLVSLARLVSSCTACALSTTRTQVVFGAGHAAATLMFVGEGPGAEEDRRGEPCGGRAGPLLSPLIAGIGLTRDDVYIANVVKCRPPGTRNPAPGEIDACAPWLDRQLALVRPTVGVTLGNCATRLLLGTREGITRLRGREFPLSRAGIDATVIPTYHPAAVLRSGGPMLAEVRADSVRVKRRLATR